MALIRFPERLPEAVRSPQEFRKCPSFWTKVPLADGMCLIAFNGDNRAIFEGEADAARTAAYAAHGLGTADSGGYIRLRFKLHGRLLMAAIFFFTFFIEIRTAR